MSTPDERATPLRVDEITLALDVHRLTGILARRYREGDLDPILTRAVLRDLAELLEKWRARAAKLGDLEPLDAAWEEMKAAVAMLTTRVMAGAVDAMAEMSAAATAQKDALYDAIMNAPDVPSPPGHAQLLKSLSGASAFAHLTPREQAILRQRFGCTCATGYPLDGPHHAETCPRHRRSEES